MLILNINIKDYVGRRPVLIRRSGSIPSDNIVFTLRSLAAPWSARRKIDGAGSGGQPCEAKSVGPDASRLKPLGFVNTRDVRRHTCSLNHNQFVNRIEIKARYLKAGSME